MCTDVNNEFSSSSGDHSLDATGGSSSATSAGNSGSSRTGSAHDGGADYDRSSSQTEQMGYQGPGLRDDTIGGYGMAPVEKSQGQQGDLA